MAAPTVKPEDVESGRWIFSAYRHLRACEAAQAAVFEATMYAGKSADILGRLRGLDEYPATGVRDLAMAAGIPGLELRDMLIPRMEMLGILRVDRHKDGTMREVQAFVLGEDDVMTQATRLWNSFDPSGAERAAITIMRELAVLPRTRDETFRECLHAGLNDEEARHGLELALAHRLAYEIDVPDFATTLLYNDYLWGENIQQTASALAVLKTDVRDNLRSLLEELHKHEGRPLDEIDSAPPDLVNLAVVKGIVESTPVQTSDGKEAHFHFSPRFRGCGVSREDPPDALSQIRLVMASFAFATRFARFRLRDPEVFLESLISRGYAGSASPIGTDYGEMEKQKIVTIVPTGPSRFGFEAVKRDTLTQALDAMRAGMLLHPATSGGTGGSGLFDQRFTDPITNRVRLSQQAAGTPDYDRAMLASVREAAQGGAWA